MMGDTSASDDRGGGVAAAVEQRNRDGLMNAVVGLFLISTVAGLVVLQAYAP
jgi:hypothetical protein